MPILNLKVTNPEAIELIRKIKSGEIFTPILAWLKKNRWYLVAVGVFIVLLIALVIGKKLSENAQTPVFSPPDIETVTPTVTTTVQSSFSGLKKNIQDLNTDIPDPYIPTFDNNINLEETSVN
jgi:hypothetical protein